LDVDFEADHGLIARDQFRCGEIESGGGHGESIISGAGAWLARFASGLGHRRKHARHRISKLYPILFTKFLQVNHHLCDARP
jgi:hypothetical protein